MTRTIYHVFMERHDEFDDSTDLLESYWTYEEAKKKAKELLLEEWGEDDFENLEENEKDGVYEIVGTFEEGEEYKCYTSTAEIDSPPPKNSSHKNSKKRGAPSPPPESSSTSKHKVANTKSTSAGDILYSIMREDSTNRYNGDGSYDSETYEHGLYTSWAEAREVVLELVDEEFEGEKNDYETYEVVDEEENEKYEVNVRDMEGDEYRIWIVKKEVKGKAPSGPKGKAKGREKAPSKPQAKVKAKKKGNK